MAVLSFLAAAVYWPGVAGAATSSRWALLALVVPWLVREQRMTAAHMAGGAFLLWAAVTLIWASNRYDGINSIFILLTLSACFSLGVHQDSLRRMWIGAGLGLGLSAVIIALDYFMVLSFMPGPALGGLFVNRNFFAEAAALVLIAAVAERIWWLIPLLLPAMLMTESRGAALSLAVALAVYFRQQWRVVLPIAVIAAVAIAAFSFKVDHSASERLVIWHSTVNGLTFFGHGLGSFWSAYPQFDLRTVINDTPEQAHNELLTIAFELGFVGVLLALAFAAALAGPIDTARLVLIGIAVQSITQFPLHLPTTAFLGMVAAGHAVRRAPLLRDFVDRCRISYWPRRQGATI